MFSPEFIQRMKEKLLDYQAKFTTELEALPAHEEIGDRPDDQAQEQATDDVHQDIAARIKSDLQAIAEALERIEAGTYGLDIETGEPIDQKRLEVYPWAKKAL